MYAAEKQSIPGAASLTEQSGRPAALILPEIKSPDC